MVALDDDDDYVSLPGCTYFKVPRLHSLSAYQNYLWQKAKGKWFFVLNDDVKCLTKGWDEEILKLPLNRYGRTKPYGPKRFGVEYSEFPVIGCNAARKLGYLMPPYYSSWGADKYIFKVFDKCNLLFDLNIELDHYRVMDETHHELKKINNDKPCLITNDVKRLSQ